MLAQLQRFHSQIAMLLNASLQKNVEFRLNLAAEAVKEVNSVEAFQLSYHVVARFLRHLFECSGTSVGEFIISNNFQQLLNTKVYFVCLEDKLLFKNTVVKSSLEKVAPIFR